MSRTKELAEEIARLTAQLEECWALLGEVAVASSPAFALAAEALLRKQGAPGWKGPTDGA